MTTQQPVALVTGTSSGIGQEAARALGQAGFAVVGTSRRGPRLANSWLVPFSSKQKSRNCSRPGPVSRISCQPPMAPCMASHLSPPENCGGGAAATASSTAASWAYPRPSLPGGSTATRPVHP